MRRLSRDFLGEKIRWLAPLEIQGWIMAGRETLYRALPDPEASAVRLPKGDSLQETPGEMTDEICSFDARAGGGYSGCPVAVRRHSIFAPFLLQVGYRLRGLDSTVVAR
jgi:hypothetical protein